MNIKKLKRIIKEGKNSKDFIHFMREYIGNSATRSMWFAGFLLVISCLPGAIVNLISADEKLNKYFIVSMVGGLAITFFGFIVFLPFWRFRSTFHYLDDEGQKLAKKLVAISNRAKRVHMIGDGILAFQLFRIERHTMDKEIIIHFDEMMTVKSKYLELNKLDEDELIVPISLYRWLENPKKKKPRDYGPFLNGLLYQWMELQQGTHLRISRILRVWNIRMTPNITGIHFVVLFDIVNLVDSDEFTSSMIDEVNIMGYTGFNESHSNRKYYTVRVLINGQEDGSIECAALIIANETVVAKHEVLKAMQYILNGG